MERIRPQQFHESIGVEDWRVVGEWACAYFRTGSFAVDAQFVQAISEMPGVGDDHPDVDVRQEGVIVRLITVTDEYCGLAERHVELARQISAVARTLDIPADLSAVQTVQVTIDTLAGRVTVKTCGSRLADAGLGVRQAWAGSCGLTSTLTLPQG